MKKKSRYKKSIRILFSIIVVFGLLILNDDIRSTAKQTVRIVNNKINRIKQAKNNMDGEVLWISSDYDNQKPVKESFCVWPYYDFDKAIDKAAIIIRGKVLERSIETKGLPIYNQDGSIYDYDYYREVTVDVLDVIKGEGIQETLIYKEPGGESENYIHKFAGVSPLEIGGEYIFFLVKNNTFVNPSTVIAISEGLVRPSSELLPEISTIQNYSTANEIAVEAFVDAIKLKLN